MPLKQNINPLVWLIKKLTQPEYLYTIEGYSGYWTTSEPEHWAEYNLSLQYCSFEQVKPNKWGRWVRTGHYLDLPCSEVRVMILTEKIKGVSFRAVREIDQFFHLIGKRRKK